jgi:hypothetical protein
MGQEDIEHEAVAMAVPTKSSVMAPPGSSVMAPPGSSTVAVPTGNATSNVPMWQQEKEGAKCCGCCCDYRRAVIIIAIITICISLGAIILTVASSVSTTQIDIDDDALLEIWDDSLRTQAIFSGVSLVCAICALVGANMFNIPLVALNTLWYVANFIAGTIVNIQTSDEINAETDDDLAISVIPTIAISAAIACIFMYPHIGFMYEIKKGIMSFETYPREEFSCCCAPGARRG